MGVFEHTAIAMISLVIAYLAGHFIGHGKGSLIGVAVALDWVENKVGTAQFNRWMREHEEASK